MSGKTIPSNTSWAGNPARELSRNIFWNDPCVHGWTDNQTQKSQIFEEDIYVYRNDPAVRMPFEELDRRLTDATDASERYDYLCTLTQKTDPNRFALEPAPNKKKRWFHK